MAHSLPVAEIQKALQSAVDEFSAASKEIKREEEQLEADMMQAFEKQKIEALKRKLTI